MPEFHSIELAQWLHQQKCYFVLPQKKETTFREKRAKFQPVSALDIRPGEGRFDQQVYWTQTRKSERFNLAVYWKRKYRRKQQKEPWYLLTNLPQLEVTLQIYRQRFGIEAMFSDCKTGGYNLEGSKASPERLTRLILLIAFFYDLRLVAREAHSVSRFIRLYLSSNRKSSQPEKT